MKTQTDKQIKCTECNQLFMVDVLTLMNEHPYCETCYNQLFCYECEVCGEFSEHHNMYELPDNDDVYRCAECLSPDYEFCEKCNSVTLQDEITETADGQFVCEDCIDKHYTRCDNCSTYHRDNDVTHIANDGDYCEDCIDESYRLCAGCGEYIHIDHVLSDDYEYYCEDCFPFDDGVDDENLHDYSYVPDYRFYGNNENSLFFGIELEIENEADSNYLGDINDDCHSMFYAKHDGSLDNGLEIVSHPTTFEYFNTHFKTTWKTILECKKHGYRSYNTSTCGIHIHMSKKAFSTLHLYKFMRFFYRNNDFIKTISQRTDEALDSWASNSKTGENIVHKAKYKKGNERRYAAINLQPHSTVEIRIFRGTLDETSFRKNVEFLHALYHFTKIYGTSDMTVYKFGEYVSENKKQYSNLYKFIHRG